MNPYDVAAADKQGRERLVHMAKVAAAIAPTDKENPRLAVIHTTYTDNKLVMTATDGFTAARMTARLPNLIWPASLTIHQPQLFARVVRGAGPVAGYIVRFDEDGDEWLALHNRAAILPVETANTTYPADRVTAVIEETIEKSAETTGAPQWGMGPATMAALTALHRGVSSLTWCAPHEPTKPLLVTGYALGGFVRIEAAVMPARL